MDIEEAKKKILSYLSLFADGYEPMLVEDQTIIRDFGWIFFYNSKEYLLDKNLSYALAGNSPILFEKQSGLMYNTGTAHPIEYYIDLYAKSNSNLDLIELPDLM